MLYVTAESIKVSPKFRKDYEVYKRWAEITKGGLDFAVNIPFPESPDGLTAIECLYVFDTYGRKEPCSEIKEMKEVLNGKSGLNFQIQQWAEGIVDGLFSKIEFMESYPWLPDWVWDSLNKEVWKRR